jgi:sialate O-acetylesterase
MIADWRVKFGIGEFPFYFVQLAGYQPGSGFPATRLSQLAALKLPNTGFATAIDIGDPTDIHPIYKQIVGQRLFLNAANMIYGKPVEFRGPTYKTSSVTQSGNIAYVMFTFSNADGGIVAKGTPKCVKCCTDNQNTFEVVTTARTQYFAPSKVLVSSSAGSVTLKVELQDNEQIVAARYAYFPYPECIFHGASSTLPMPPFVVSFK